MQLFESPELLDLAVVETDSLLGSLQSLFVEYSKSSLFVAELLWMYGRFARVDSWVPTVLANSESDGGGFKDAILGAKGTGAYNTLH